MTGNDAVTTLRSARPAWHWGAAVCLAALGLTACATRVPPSLPPGRPLPADPAAVYAYVRAQEDRIHTMRARFTAAVSDTSDERTADGVLLVKKPDCFRLRLMSVLGPTVLDYVNAGGHARLALPLQGKQLVDAELADATPFSPAEMRRAFLRADAAFPGLCVPSAAGEDVVVTCRDAADEVLRTIRIAAATGLVSEETSFAAGRPRAVTHFDDYRRVETFELPFSIRIEYPGQDVHIAITVRRYELNPVLGDALFEVADSAGS